MRLWEIVLVVAVIFILYIVTVSLRFEKISGEDLKACYRCRYTNRFYVYKYDDRSNGFKLDSL